MLSEHIKMKTNISVLSETLDIREVYKYSCHCNELVKPSSTITDSAQLILHPQVKYFAQRFELALLYL